MNAQSCSSIDWKTRIGTLSIEILFSMEIHQWRLNPNPRTGVYRWPTAIPLWLPCSTNQSKPSPERKLMIFYSSWFLWTRFDIPPDNKEFDKFLTFRLLASNQPVIKCLCKMFRLIVLKFCQLFVCKWSFCHHTGWHRFRNGQTVMNNSIWRRRAAVQIEYLHEFHPDVIQISGALVVDCYRCIDRFTWNISSSGCSNG